MVRELRQGGHGAVVEPVFELSGRLGPVDHRAHKGYASSMDQGMVGSEFKRGDASQGARHVSEPLRARKMDYTTGEVAGIPIGGWVGATLCVLREGGTRGGFS